MNDVYSTYRYKRYETKRKPKLFLIVALILFLAVMGSMIALYFGGFSFEKIKDNPKDSNAVTTPEMVFWVVEVPNFDSKTTAIAQTIATKGKGGAGYLLQKGAKWTVIEGVYLNSADANREMAREDATQTAVSDKYTIPKKEIIVPKNVCDTANNFFTQVKTAYETLIEKRQEFADEKITHDDIILIANNLYTKMKATALELANLNNDANNANISNIIYVANQNILSLHNLIYANTERTAFNAKLNNAIATTIFSLTFL
jgi:hypothetical protein